MSGETRRWKRQSLGLLCPDEPFELEFTPEAVANDHTLTVDLYDAANPVHPRGHFGYWNFAPDGRESFTLTVDPTRDPPIALDAEFRDGWRNPDLDLASVARLQLVLVLRQTETRAVIWHVEIPWVRERRALEEAARLLEAPDYVRELSPPTIPLPEGARIHVVAPDVRAGDAIGNLALDVTRTLRHHGYPVELWAKHLGTELWGVGRSLELIGEGVGPGDLIFYQYSILDPDLARVLACPGAKLCFYQGVTPPRYLEGVDATTAEACRRGIAELHELAGFDAWVAATAFTAGELRDALGGGVRVDLVPPTLNLGRFDALAPAPVALPGSGRFLLYVGRFAPHKGLALLVDAFAAYAALDPKCDLVLAGAPGGDDVARRRAALPPEIAARVHVVSGASDAQLATLYQAATAYVSASEHEGFCVPLAEAFGFGKPVFAYDTPAVRETLGGAGRLFATRDPVALAALWQRVLHDPGELEAQLEGQRRRWHELRRAADGHLLWEALARAVGGTARPS